MTVNKIIDVSQQLTEEQRKMLEALKERPVELCSDCPELSEEELAQFQTVSEKTAQH